MTRQQLRRLRTLGRNLDGLAAEIGPMAREEFTLPEHETLHHLRDAQRWIADWIATVEMEMRDAEELARLEAAWG